MSEEIRDAKKAYEEFTDISWLFDDQKALFSDKLLKAVEHMQDEMYNLIDFSERQEETIQDLTADKSLLEDKVDELEGIYEGLCK